VKQIIDREFRKMVESMADARCDPTRVWDKVDYDAMATKMLTADQLRLYRTLCMAKAVGFQERTI